MSAAAGGAGNTERFTGLAAAYTRGRPSYPDEAFTAMLDGVPAGRLAVDVGCGTGISTRLLETHAARTVSSGGVIGVDPNPDMLDEARRADPDGRIRWIEAPAESTGLGTGCAGLVLAAQAFHWFDPERALAEFARLLVPGGRCALLWNLRDDRDDGTRRYSEISVPAAKRGLDATSLRAREVGGTPLRRTSLFRDYRELEFTNEQSLDLDGLLERARSASYFPKAGPERADAERALRALFEERARDGRFTIRYRVELHLAEVAPRR